MPATPNYQGRFLQGTDTNMKVGDKIEAGLPNIKGQLIPVLGRSVNSFTRGYGAFSETREEYRRDVIQGGPTPFRASNVFFNASKSNPIYGKSNTVQPPSVVVKYIIKAE